jgi:hypothetical protein
MAAYQSKLNRVEVEELLGRPDFVRCWSDKPVPFYAIATAFQYEQLRRCKVIGSVCSFSFSFLLFPCLLFLFP